MVNFAGVVFAVLFMWFFAWLFVSAYRFASVKENAPLLPDNRNRFAFAFFAFAGACMCYYLVVQDRYIYTWDMSQYWTQSFTQMRFLFSDPLLAIMRLGGTIWFADYNSILPTIVAIPLKLVGITFVRYVLVNYALFLVPTWFILAAVVRKQAGKNYTLLTIFAAFTFCPFFYAVLFGYIDAACLIPASLALLLLKDYNPLSFDREQIKRDIYISSLLLCCIMFRRYFVFYVQGYVAGLVILSVYSVMKASGDAPKTKLAKNAVLNIAVIGLFALAVMMIFFAPMLLKIMRNKYSEMYSMYDRPIIAKIMSVLAIFGGFNIFAGLLGVILPLIRGHMRKYSCCCAAALIVSACTFFKVQAMGIHHIYVLVPYVFVLFCIGIIQLAELFRKRAAIRFVYTLCVVIMTLGAMHCYLPAARPVLSPLSGMFGNVYNVRIRNDIPVLNELAGYLNSLTDGTDKAIYMPAHTGVLNYSTLESLRKPYEALPVRNLIKTCLVDLVDGFPIGFLSADFIVTTDSENVNQHVIRFLSKEVMDSASPIGRHFEKLDRIFTLDGNVHVFVYERKSAFTQEDLQYLADYFSKAYPGHNNIFADRILSRQKIANAIAYRFSPKVVEVLRWLLEKKLFTPEQLAAASNRPVYEIRHLTDK